MKLLERYALGMGAKIDAPFINTKFFPLPFEKYITFGAAGAMPAKNYGYFNQVLELLVPVLQEHGIHIVQLGLKDEPQFNNVYRLCGATSISQSAYIVKNSLLHLGVDSFLVHAATAFDVPLVSLYSVSPPSVCGPHFGSSNKQVCLIPNFKTDYTWSFNPQEPDKSVDSIKVEDVVKSVGKLLGLKFPEIETKFIGSQYNFGIVEVVPDCVIPPDMFNGVIPIIRFDLGGEAGAVYQQLQIRKCTVLTKTPLDLTLLKQLRPNIDRIVYLIEKDYQIEFIKGLYMQGIPFVLITELPDEDIGLMKLDASEFGVINQKPKAKKPEIEVSDRTHFKTNKLIFSKGAPYPSIPHLKASIVNQSDNKVIDTPEFWNDSDFYFVFNK